MIDGASLVTALADAGVTHVVWIPDSELGTWESALAGARKPSLIRTCREGEALGVAAGLLLGGKKPVVVIQCTGLFEAGDALRNVIHDLKLPLFLIIGVRGYRAVRQGKSGDTCPRFTEPIMNAWQVPYELFEGDATPAEIVVVYRQAQAERRAGAVLLAE